MVIGIDTVLNWYPSSLSTPALVTTVVVLLKVDFVEMGMTSDMVKAVGDGPGVSAGNILEVTVEGILIGGK